MKHKKQLIMILIIVFLLVGLGTLAAADVTKNDTSVTKNADVTKTNIVSKDTTSTSKVEATTKSDDNKKIIETKTNPKTNKITDKTIKKTDITKNVKTAGSYTENVKNYAELLSAVENAKTNTYNKYTINLTPGDYIATDEIIWENSPTTTLIIEGNNNTLNGNNSNLRFITIAEDHNLILNNITIENYSHTEKVSDNIYECYGGAIYNNGNLRINNSILQKNQINLTIINGEYPPDMRRAYALGGAIHNNNNLTIQNSRITNNQIIIKNDIGVETSYCGGVIYNNGTLTLTDSTLNNNNANESGGAIHNDHGNLNITRSNLTHNNATNGGAITNGRGTLTITDSNLNNNNAASGGAIINSHSASKIIITNSNLTHNTATLSGIYAGGGAIHNYGTLNITNSNLTHNNANESGGAIYNIWGTLNITDSNLTHNNATNGGTIYDYTRSDMNNKIILFNSNFTENKAENGTVLYNYGGYGTYNITYNTFKINTASSDKETLNLGPKNRDRLVKENTYDNTDINLKTINLTTQDKKTEYQYNEDIILNYTVELQNPEYYDENILDKINKTLYINTIENSTTKEKNYTLTKLKPGHHTICYKTCNYESNNLTLTVIGDSEITTDKTVYDHINGIKNKITLNIIDPSEEKGRITLTVKDQDEYKELSSYSNVGNGYQLSTDILVESLENIYNTLNQSYVINVTYYSEYTNPSSTNFTLNIIQKRNTTIEYEIINNTDGNVQINITVLDAIYKTPIPNAHIIITGALTNETSAGIITDNTLKAGKYNITVNYNGTEDYNKSNTTIDFTVEIDKDAKITELETNITNLTQEIKDAQQEIQNLTETNNQLEQQLSTLLKTLEDLNTTINNLTKQLENARQEIQDLNQTITELNKTLDTTINIKPVTSSVGSQVNLTATITDTAGNKVTTGKVLFKVNGLTLKDKSGNVIYAIVNNGEATLTTKTQAAWIKNTTNIQAVYSGEKPYKSSRTNTTNINITKGKATITLEEKTITAKAGQTITLKAKILDSNGDRINNDKVVFKLNGRTLTDKDGKTIYARVVDGEAVLEYTIPENYNAKTYNLTAVFGGNYYERTQTQGTIILEKKATTITPENITTTNDKTTIKATIRDETGKPLVTSTKIAIKINGKTITSTNSTNGTINTSFTTTLKPGTYELTIISGENGQYKTGKMTTILKI